MFNQFHTSSFFLFLSLLFFFSSWKNGFIYLLVFPLHFSSPKFVWGFTVYIHYNKVNFFLGSKLLKKVLKALKKKYYFDGLTDPWWPLKKIPFKQKFLQSSWPLKLKFQQLTWLSKQMFYLYRGLATFEKLKGIKGQ